MASKKPPKPTPPLERAEPFNPDQLELDRRNPRFGGDDVPAGRKGEAAIIRRLVEAADIAELLESIAANGYLDLEPLFVIEERERFVVVEGNRRVAAVKLLRDPALALEVGVQIPTLSSEVRATLEEIHAIRMESRDTARQLIGFKHINGTHKWDSYAKARFAAEWYRKERGKGTTLADIARSLGDRHDTVQRLVQGVFVLDQAGERGLFEPTQRFPGRIFFFSHLYTALARPEFRTFLELPAKWRDVAPSDNPVPKSGLPKLEELLNWLYGSKEKDEAPVIVSQNPDLKHLGEVLGSAPALKRLRTERDLKEAYEWSGARARQFSDYLIRALTHAEKASAVAYAYEPEPTLLESAENLVKASRSILTQMKAMTKEAAEMEEE